MLFVLLPLCYASFRALQFPIVRGTPYPLSSFYWKAFSYFNLFLYFFRIFLPLLYSQLTFCNAVCIHTLSYKYMYTTSKQRTSIAVLSGITTFRTIAAAPSLAIYYKIENVLWSLVVVCFEFTTVSLLLCVVVLSQMLYMYRFCVEQGLCCETVVFQRIP